MALTVHRAERTDALADELGDLLADPLPDPLAQEVVVVPAKGVERWVTQRLAHRLGVGARGDDGVCAGVSFLSPHSLVTLLLGTDRDDPWLPHRMTWPLLASIDEAMDEPWAKDLARHLGHAGDDAPDDLRAGRRYAVASRLATRFWQYGQQRPELLDDWRDGHVTDGAGAPLSGDLRWEPYLWRAVAERIGGPDPAQRLDATEQRLRAGGDDLDLPDRLSLFGHTRLAVADLRLLSALGVHREVHLWLPSPSPALWERLTPLVAAGPVPRHEDLSVGEVRHPLLRSLGRDTREVQRALAGVAAVDAGTAASPSRPGTLLGRLQADIAADRTPDGSAPVDDSLQVHACHGPARQVEVLREVLVGMLQDDPSLEPRDVLVMCPDIETYAPLIQAAFGLDDLADGPDGSVGHPGHRLRVQLADRSLTATNPLLAVTVRILSLATGRMTAGDVLDLIGTEAVRRRFGIDEDDLDTVAAWVEQAGVRWGLDGEHRGAFALSGLASHTWSAGLDRLALGVTRAAGAEHHVGDVEPLDDVDSGDVELAGSVLELLDRLGRAHAALQDARSAADWVAALREAVAGLTDVPLVDAWQQAQLERELGAVAQAAEGSTQLRLSDVRVLLEGILAGRPTRAGFRTGTLTACTMVPMRSVPHRVVCLLGMDDGVFPRRAWVDGDDVLGRDPRTGERDGRSEDRQLLLDAVMAATQRLVVTYSGASEHTGGARPPAVPVGELLESAALTCGRPADDLVLHHPLQSFDTRNLTPDALLPRRVLSFDPAALAGARTAAAERVPVPPLLPGPLPPRPGGGIVSVEQLLAFVLNPVGTFLRTRLDVLLPLEADEPSESIPVELDSLEKWQVGDRALEQLLAGRTPQQVAGSLRRSGMLPPGALGDDVLREVGRTAERIAGEAAPLRTESAQTLEVDVDLGDGRRLIGTVGGLHGSTLVTTTYSSLSARHRLQAWIGLLALAAGRPEVGDPAAAAVGRRRGGAATVRYAGVDAEEARARLRDLLDLYERGMTEPLPMPLKTGYSYARALASSARVSPTSAKFAAREDWEGKSFPGENALGPHAYLYGAGSRIEVLLDRPRPEEAWSGATTRLGQYATRLWAPTFTAEQR